MLLAKFLDAISRWLPPQRRPELEAAIASLNPDKIYIENVRNALGVSTQTAVDACEAAVRQGLFNRRIEVISPDGSVATSASREEDLPRTISYWKQDQNDIDEVEMETSSLRKLLSYSLR